MKPKFLFLLLVSCFIAINAKPLDLVDGLLGNVIGNEQKITSSKGIAGNGNTKLDVLEASPQLNVVADVLNTVEQIIAPAAAGATGLPLNNIAKNSQTQTKSENIIGSGNTNIKVADVSPQLDVGVGVLNDLTQGLLGGDGSGKAGTLNNIKGTSQDQKPTHNIVGKNNVDIEALKVSPQINIGANILSDVKQLILPKKAGKPHAGHGNPSVLQPAPTNVISDTQSQTDKENILGNGNIVADVAKVNPQVNAGVGLLDTVTQTLIGGAPAKPDSGLLDTVTKTLTGDLPLGPGSPSNPSNSISKQQSQTDKQNIMGNGNIVADVAKVNPQANVGVGLLDAVTQTLTGGAPAKPGSGLLDTVTKTLTGDLPLGPGSPSNPSNSISKQQSQTDKQNILGNGNIVADVAKVNPQVNVGVGLLDAVTQTLTGGAPAKPGSDLLDTVTKTLTGALPLGPGSPSNPSNSISKQQSQNSNTNIVGDNNLEILGPVVKPQVIAQIDVLDDLLQGVGLGGVVNGGNNTQELRQSANDRTQIKGNGNTLVGLGKIAPQLTVKANILSEVKQLLGVIKNPTLLLTGDDPECENAMKIMQDQNSELNVVGDNNLVLNGPDVSPQIIVDLNVISDLLQSGRCQVSVSTTVPPVTIPPVTVPPVTVPPVTVPPVTVPPVTLPSVTVPPVTVPPITVPPVTVPPVTVPPVTVPPVTVPPVTVPSITVPPVTVRPVTVPPVTLPPVTVPPVTVPPVPVPPITVPPITLTTVTVPPVTVPPVTVPPIAVPPVTVPPVTVRPITVPPVTVPPVPINPSNSISKLQSQTDNQSIMGNGNIVANVAKVNPQVDVGVGLLNTVSQTLAGALPLGSASPSNPSNSISNQQSQTDSRNIMGNGNIVANVAKVNPQVDVGVGLLDTVTQTLTGAAPASPSSGLPDTVTQTLTEADPASPVSGLLEKVTQTVSGALPLRPASPSNPSNSISKVQSQTDKQNIMGNGNIVADVAKVNPQANVGVGLLDAVTQTLTGGAPGKPGSGLLDTVTKTLTGDLPLGPSSPSNPSNSISKQKSQTDKQNILGNGNIVADVAKVNPQVNVGVGLLDAVTQTLTGGAPAKPGSGLLDTVTKTLTGDLPLGPGSPSNPSNSISKQQSQTDKQNILGNGNIVADVAKVNPQVNVGVGLLDAVTQTLTGGAPAKPGSGLLDTVTKTLTGALPLGPGSPSNPSNSISKQQSQNSNTNIVGDNNLEIVGPVVKPQVIAQIDVLDDLLQGVGLGGVVNGGNNTQELRQSANDRTQIKGSGNTLLGLGKIAPQLTVKANILSEVKQLLGVIKNPTLLLTGDDPECENAMKIMQDQNSELNVVGDNNLVLNGPDVSPQITVDLNVISDLLQSGRCQVSVSTTVPSVTIPPVTVPPVTVPPVTVPPVTVPPVTVPPVTVPPVTVSPVTVPPVTVPPVTVPPVTVPPVTVPPDTVPPVTVPPVTVPPITVPPVTLPPVTVPPVTVPPVTVPPVTVPPVTVPPVTVPPITVPPITLPPVTVPPVTVPPVTVPPTTFPPVTVPPVTVPPATLPPVIYPPYTVPPYTVPPVTVPPVTVPPVTVSPVPINPSNSISKLQSQTDNQNIMGNGNIVTNVAKVNPQVDVGVDLLNTVSQTLAGALPLGSASPSNPSNSISNQKSQTDNQNIMGNGNIVANLAKVNPQVDVGVGLLNTVTQTLTGALPLGSGNPSNPTNSISKQQSQNSNTNIVGDNNLSILGPVVNPQVIAQIDVLDDLLQEVGLGGVVNGGKNAQKLQQSANDRSQIKGNGNTLLGLGKIAPQLIVKADILSEVKQLLGVIKNPTLLLTGLNGNDPLCENAVRIIQEQNSEFNVIGDNNFVLEGLNVSPQIIADLNIISSLIQSGRCQANIATTVPPVTLPPVTLPPVTLPPATLPPVTLPPVIYPTYTVPPYTVPPVTVPPVTVPPVTVSPVPMNPSNSISKLQSQTDKQNIMGNGNIVANVAKVNPQVDVGVGLLNTVSQKLAGALPLGSASPSNPSNSILNKQSQTDNQNIIGNGNIVANVAKVNPQVDVGVGLLNTVTQKLTGALPLGSGNPSNPTNSISKQQSLPPVTLPPVIYPTYTVPPYTVPPVTVPPVTVPPVTVPPKKRCFRRFCRKWRMKPTYICQ